MLHNENRVKEQKFITYPVDMEVHHKVDLRGATVYEESNQQFKELCTQFQDVFSVDVSHVAKISHYGQRCWGSPPISQRLYNLS